MQSLRPVPASNPLLFGRGPARLLGEGATPKPRLSDDLKLFAATCAAGFLFVSILIG
jgi:hypothetical protein